MLDGGGLVECHDQIEVVVRAGLAPEQRIHAPAAVEPRGDLHRGEALQDAQHVGGGHHGWRSRMRCGRGRAYTVTRSLMRSKMDRLMGTRRSWETAVKEPWAAR